MSETQLQACIEKETPFISEDSADEKYRLLAVLDEGGFGMVCTAERRSDGEKVAIKFPKDGMIMEEANICRDLLTPACDYIVRYLDVVQPEHPSANLTGMVMELCHTDLYTFWQTEWRKTRMTANIMTVIMQQIWTGMAHVHGKGIVHNDIYSERNILIDASSGTMKLADFGSASLEHDKHEFRLETLRLARMLSRCASNSLDEHFETRMDLCVMALASDPVFLQHPSDVKELLRYVFHPHYYWMQSKETWWDEWIAKAPHVKEMATKAVQWMHMCPEPGSVSLPIEVATTFVRAFGFQSYDAMYASGIADDIALLTTPSMREECTKLFQDYQKEKMKDVPPDSRDDLHDHTAQ